MEGKVVADMVFHAGHLAKGAEAWGGDTGEGGGGGVSGGAQIEGKDGGVALIPSRGVGGRGGGGCSRLGDG